jgi:hypothetical protein
MPPDMTLALAEQHRAALLADAATHRSARAARPRLRPGPQHLRRLAATLAAIIRPA